MANTYDTYPAEWATSLQMRLNKPTTWKEVARVLYKNVQVFNVPYLTTATEPSFTTGTRGTAIIPTDHQISQDVLTISNYRYAANYIDRADLAQYDIFQATEAGKLQGSIIDEGIEAVMLANHAAWTDFGDTGGGVFGLAATQITVSSTNIDDIVRAVEEQIVTANGKDVMKEKGIFIIWRAADRTKLAAFAQAKLNGLVKSLFIDLEALIQRVTGGKQELTFCAA